MSITHFSLFKRPNGTWYIIYRDNNQVRWKSTGSKLKSDALQAVAQR